ncbi:MAG: radical SAM protein [Nanoarchaeota archaeon]
MDSTVIAAQSGNKKGSIIIPPITRNQRISTTANEEKIREQIKSIESIIDKTVDPVANMSINLDSTRISRPEHRERVELLRQAWKEGVWPPRKELMVAPITMDMALTQKCSFSCTYCYANLQYNEESPVKWPVYKGLLDDMASIGHKPGAGVKAVSLISDGESTENPYFYDFILYGKYEKGIDMANGTNGLKLKHDRLEEIMPALTYLRFNFSAGEKEAYKQVMGVKDLQWDKVIENIKECVRIKREKNLQTTIGLQMVLLPEYADQVIPLALLGKELGVDYTVIKHCSDDEYGSLGVDYSWYHSLLAKDLLKAAEALSTREPKYTVQAKWSKMMTGRDRKYSKCFGTPLMLQISGTCLVAPCGSFFGKDYSKYHIGSYTEKSFREIWESPRYWEVVSHLGSDKFDPRKMCATLCLQDKVNEVLFDYYESGIPLSNNSSTTAPRYINFI